MVLKPRRHSKMRATCESAVMFALGSANSSLLHEQLQQVVEKALSALGRAHAQMIAHDQSLGLRARELSQYYGDGQTGPLGEQRRVEAFGKAQRIHHELERHIHDRDLRFGLQR